MQKLSAKSFQHRHDCFDCVCVCRPRGRIYGCSRKGERAILVFIDRIEHRMIFHKASDSEKRALAAVSERFWEKCGALGF